MHSHSFEYKEAVAGQAVILVEAWRDSQRTDVIEAIQNQKLPMRAAALIGMMFEELDAQERHDLSRSLLQLAAQENDQRR